MQAQQKGVSRSSGLYTSVNKSLDQNLHHPLGEERTYPPDVVENESAGAGCHSDVGSEGQLVYSKYWCILMEYSPFKPRD